MNAPRKTSVLRIRYLVSSVAAAVMLLLAVGCYFWIMGHDKSSLPLALLEEKNVGALPGDGDSLGEGSRLGSTER